MQEKGKSGKSEGFSRINYETERLREKKRLKEGRETRWKANGRRMIRNFVHTIEERLYRRQQIKRLESYIGVRPSFPVLTFR